MVLAVTAGMLCVVITMMTMLASGWRVQAAFGLALAAATITVVLGVWLVVEWTGPSALPGPTRKVADCRDAPC